MVEHTKDNEKVYILHKHKDIQGETVQHLVNNGSWKRLAEVISDYRRIIKGDIIG